MRSRLLPCLIAMALAAPAGAETKTLSSLDLTTPFHTRSAWRFTATQGPDVPDPIFENDDQVPGAIVACLHKAGTADCQPDLAQALGPATSADDLYVTPHFLDTARIIHPQGPAAAPMLLLHMASIRSVNGNQRHLTLALAYDRGADRFVPAYRFTTGHNNNEEVRYIEDGSLKGDIVSAEPTENAPFGYWITVNRIGAGQTYRQILRFRSATHYGDNNSLAVIDSEMPNIQRRLGLWRPGAPLPLPKGPCPKPHLIATELWCQ